jgi:hypothetical protein
MQIRLLLQLTNAQEMRGRNSPLPQTGYVPHYDEQHNGENGSTGLIKQLTTPATGTCW